MKYSGIVEILAQLQTLFGQVLQVRRGNLTQEDYDAIVNTANNYLAHGGRGGRRHRAPRRRRNPTNGLRILAL